MNNVFFDTCVYHQPGIDLLVKVIRLDNILFGSEMVGAVRGIDPETGSLFRRHQALHRRAAAARRRQASASSRAMRGASFRASMRRSGHADCEVCGRIRHHRYGPTPARSGLGAPSRPTRTGCAYHPNPSRPRFVPPGLGRCALPRVWPGRTFPYAPSASTRPATRRKSAVAACATAWDLRATSSSRPLAMAPTTAPSWMPGIIAGPRPWRSHGR